jgi:hypothetical protein
VDPPDSIVTVRATMQDDLAGQGEVKTSVEGKDDRHGRLLGIHDDRPQIDPLPDGAVRVGWHEITDLRVIDANRDAFRATVASTCLDQQASSAAAPAPFTDSSTRSPKATSSSPRIVQAGSCRIGRASGPYDCRTDTAYRHWRPVPGRNARSKAIAVVGHVSEPAHKEESGSIRACQAPLPTR